MFNSSRRITARCIERWPNGHLFSPCEPLSRQDRLIRLPAQLRPRSRGNCNEFRRDGNRRRLNNTRRDRTRKRKRLPTQRFHNSIARHLRLPFLRLHSQLRRQPLQNRGVMYHFLVGRRTMSSGREGLAVVRRSWARSTYVQKISFSSFFPLILQGVSDGRS